MKKYLLIGLIVVLSLPWAVHAQLPQNQTPEQQVTAATDPNYPLWLGIGAITATVLWNWYSVGVSSFASIPGALAPGMTILPEWSVAMSRVFAVGMAVIGALIADSFYMNW